MDMPEKSEMRSSMDDIEMGPIDFIVVEWPPDRQPNGEAFPHLLNLVEAGMIRRDDDVRLDRVDGAPIEPRVELPAIQQARICLAAQHHALHPLGEAVRELQREARIPLGAGRREDGKHSRRQGRRARDPQGPGDVVVLGSRELDELLEVAEDAARQSEHPRAAGGQSHPLRRPPHEQLHRQALLEFPQCRRYRGLRCRALHGRAADGAGVGRGDEVLELADRHGKHPFSLCFRSSFSALQNHACARMLVAQPPTSREAPP